MYGMSNFDILRWDGLVNGTQRSAIGTFIASLLMPGAPLVSFSYKVSMCSTTLLLTISLGKSTCADRACTGTDIWQFARRNQNVPDPFMEQGVRGALTPRPFSQYSTSSRLSSVESIATIVDEKQNSALNKANEAVRDPFIMHDSHTY